MRHRVLLVLGLALLVVSGSAVRAPSAEAALKAIWGPNLLPDGSSAFRAYKDLGVDVLQRQVRWNTVAPTRPARPRDPNDPAYVWPADLDAAVRSARRNRIRMAIMVMGTPGWANGGRDWRYVPTRARDYGDFVAAVARRYPRVRHWMVWGEPSRTANFQPLPVNNPEGPRAYAKILDRAYIELKRRSRRNVVIGGMTFSGGEVGPADWVRYMKLPNGRPPRLDWYGHNPFSRRFPDLRNKLYFPGVRDFSDLDTFSREIRRAYRVRHKRPRLWLSEWTISSDRTNEAFNFYVSREEQARWLTAGYRIAHRRRDIAGLGWFGLLDQAKENGLTTGLMTSTGERKPAYYAYKRAR